MSFLLFFAYLGTKFFCLLDSLAIPPPAKSDRRTRSLYHMTNHNSFLLSLAASQFTIKVLWVSVRFLRLSSPLFHHRQILRPHESPVAGLQFLQRSDDTVPEVTVRCYFQTTPVSGLRFLPSLLSLLDPQIWREISLLTCSLQYPLFSPSDLDF